MKNIKIQKYTAELHIIDNGSLITYINDKPVNFTININNEAVVKIQLIFTADNSRQKELCRDYDDTTDTIKLICKNFSNHMGTGTAEPIKILTYREKVLYINFWIFQLGNTGLKRVDYTFYLEM